MRASKFWYIIGTGIFGAQMEMELDRWEENIALHENRNASGINIYPIRVDPSLDLNLNGVGTIIFSAWK